MDSKALREVVEALLFSADVPLRSKTLAEVLGDDVSARDVNAAVKELNARYEETGAAFRIEEIAGGLQLLSRAEYDGWIKKLAKARQRTRLSRAALETLAIIAYRQPLTRPAIEAIRGVDVGGVLGTLLERGLVRLAGRAETVGRPHLYATTPAFLSHFGLKSLSTLPRLEEVTKEMDRRGLVQDLARELGEDPDGLDETLDAFMVAGDGAVVPGSGEDEDAAGAPPEPEVVAEPALAGDRTPESADDAEAQAVTAEAPNAGEADDEGVDAGAANAGVDAEAPDPAGEGVRLEASPAADGEADLDVDVDGDEDTFDADPMPKPHAATPH